ncbi:Basal-body rod modification protein FlgD [Fundidesulfovibrio magnetotacticus]|uniref:Basal-body rod modification protein FlgD n=1 Tax=Fundidesulfovibrio magnetotacticus TaxID=2730080 RepID=A0A6V8LTV7_9BACT|nr:flagellar hook capping FlgD N-terminal domain-containing protein [Fundidesulfovibrio magnetotacticus]GFK94370.1 Basal-body rod modification protein FlgD [Fundidesulfovibrio magnetotacticus]
MYVDTTSYLNSIKTSSTSSTASSSMGKDDFLAILVAQLENQDPFNSTDPAEMIGQLTQFSILEQMTNMNETLTSTLAAVNVQTATGAVSYIGKTVMAQGSTLSVEDGTASSATYTLDSDATGLKAYIYDEDGSVVRTVTIGDQTSGDHDFQWDGKDDDGETVDDGTYTLAIAGTDADGNDVVASTVISGLVSGVSVSSGTVMLSLKDGREVALANVTSVVDTDA